MDIMASFLQAEINTQELYDDIINYIISYHIRNGEFEGNEYIIKKMDHLNFIVYSEYPCVEEGREIHSALAIYRKDLLRKINIYAKTKGILIQEIEETAQMRAQEDDFLR